MDRQMWNAKGYALIATLVILTVTASLVLGFLSQVNTQQKIGYNDGDYSTAFYAAQAGLEKMNSDLSKQFFRTVYPSATQLTTIQGATYQPSFPRVTFTTYSLIGGQQAHLNGALTAAAVTATVDSTTGWPASGYFMVDAEYMTYTALTATTLTGLSRGGNATVAAAHTNNSRVSRSMVITIGQGPNAGLNAQVVPFTLQIVAQASSGTEAKLNRDIQVALVPVFQFGVFSDSDLSFFAGPNFNFGGRVHTNGNLYLAEGGGATLTLAAKVTTAADVIRTQLSNGYSTNNAAYNGTVNAIQTPSVYRALGLGEGSLTGGPGSSTNSAWHALSLTTYNGNILTSATGAKPLTLPFVGPGVSPVEIIKRPVAGEDTQSIVSESRLYNQASLRVLISDAQANLPGGTGHPLNAALAGAPDNYVVDATHPPFAVADPSDADYQTATNTQETANTALINGFIRIDMQKNDNSWQDVTMEILNFGISGGNDIAAAPNPNAILRFQNLKPTKASGSTTATDYMPINLYDAREARFRDSAVTGLRKIGVMGIVELDVTNLGRWFSGAIGANGTNALNNGGYIFYFSDRRGNRDGSGNETGEFGFEDIVNSADAANGVPNNSLDNPGEDFNGNGTLETYGGNLPVSPYTAYPTNTDLYTTILDGQSTALNQGGVTNALPANGGTLTVASTANWAAASGFFVIDREAFTFTGKTATTFTGIGRAAYGTLAAAHANSAAIGVGQSTTLTGETTNLNQSGVTIGAPANGGNLTVSPSPVGIFPSSGSFTLDSEIITYTGISATQFTGLTRGASGTTKAAHTNGHAINGDQILSATNPATGQTIGMASTAGWSNSGYLLVNGEYITYSSKTATNVTVQTRGAFGSTAALQAAGSTATNADKAQKNRIWYFRRSLRLINGTAPNLPTPGFTVATENPVYVLGDYNANGSFNGAHSYAAVIGDAVTFLSDSWTDIESFDNPYTPGNRDAGTSWYRMAIAAGKGINFAQPAGTGNDYGTDGGTHNFLRYIEDWSTSTLNYLGSIVSLYYSRQATGTYKCCTIVYGPPTRAYAFDTEFLVPSQLPPGTPRFRDINNLSFRQNILSTQ